MGKMSPATLRLVLLVSCCHALVHVYEHSFATVEQLVVAEDSFGIAPDFRKEVSGTLGNCLRLPFGLCALAAGWLADRFGAKRLLLVYLLGCSVAAVGLWLAPALALLYLSLFALGMFASIYHPAGVGLISLHTRPENRTMALGYHGIMGSAGIAAGPFLAGLVMNFGADWRQFYLVLALPGVLLAVLLAIRLAHDERQSAAGNVDAPADAREDEAHWPSYFTLLALASMAGFVYAGILHFMPRYLDGAGLSFEGIPDKSLRNYLTGVVLLLGIFGQYAGGRLGRPTTLEPLLAAFAFAATPCVLWMAFAQGTSRLWAAALFSPLFFAHQPLYNSMVAKYVPRRRRSLCYGLSFTLGFGIGSFGPTFAGWMPDERTTYTSLAAILALAGTLALVLWHWHGPVVDGGDGEEAMV
jgi:MFS family permease